jgi:hypothetical protein
MDVEEAAKAFAAAHLSCLEKYTPRYGLNREEALAAVQPVKRI